MEKNTLSRAALGHVAALGDLYDVRTDNFCAISLFKKQIPEEALQLVDNHFSDITLLHSDTFTEKCSALDVKAELQVSLLAGLFTLQGAGSYLNDQKTSARAVNSSLIYNIKTRDESVNVYHEKLKEAFSIDAIQSGLATHVVVGITWGANCVLSCEYRNTDNRDVNEIKGSLSASLNKITLSVSGKAAVEFNEENKSKQVQFDIRIFGDIVPKNQELPTTFEGALNLMKQMPNLVATSNEGRGKPLIYRLIPLTLLEDYLSLSMKADSVIRYLEEESLLRVVQLFEKSSRRKQEINDFHQNAIDHKFCVRTEDMVKITSLKEEFAIQEAKLRANLATALTSVRSGKADSSDLENLIQEYLSGDFSPEKLSLQITNWGYVAEKTAFAKSLIDNGAKYIGFGTSLDEEILKNFESKTLVLYFKEEAKCDEPVVWKQNRQLFLQEMKKGLRYKYLAVDCDIHPELWPKIGICIQVLIKGAVLTENLLADQKKTQGIPLAQSTSRMEQMLAKPNKRVKLVMPCTGMICKPNIEYEWMCGKCNERIEYGFDLFFYCSCGRALASSYEFKCTDSRHESSYEKHTQTYFDELLSRIRPFKELNILILGETGVGKSTWINGFVNFLTYDSLREAEASELITLIPSEFTICDEYHNYITVSTGTDNNEVQVTGQSATQECKVYQFHKDDTKIRIIDTPGIGDTRGIQQDKTNFQNILSTLSYLQELHGICILLKPNNARLTVTFRFCVNELLTYLHKDAGHNIMFCFTNCRSTFYRPGDTMPALQALLKEDKNVEIVTSPHTVYCFDSEAYRFLAAVKNKAKPISFSEDERENYAKSWEKSINETNRMLKHIENLKPHIIQSTLNLNHARELVLTLTVPLAEINKTILTTKASIQDYLKEIESTEENMKELKKRLHYQVTELETSKLNYPKTVCSNTKCIKIFGPPERKQIEYSTVCHDHCGLSNVTQDTIGDVGLLRCWAMDGDNCRHSNCRHSYREHLHIYNEYRHVSKNVENMSVKNMLETDTSAKDIKQKMIEETTEKIKEYDFESQEIEKASAKFAYFLKHNAITPYNDAMLDYLDHLIKQEKDKVNVGGREKVLNDLVETQASYKIKIDIINKEMERGDASSMLTSSKVEDLVKFLYTLKHHGKMLENTLKVVKESKQRAAEYNEYVSPYKSNKKKNIFSSNYPTQEEVVKENENKTKKTGIFSKLNPFNWY